MVVVPESSCECAGALLAAFDLTFEAERCWNERGMTFGDVLAGPNSYWRTIVIAMTSPSRSPSAAMPLAIPPKMAIAALKLAQIAPGAARGVCGRPSQGSL